MFFDNVALAPRDPVFGELEIFAQDPRAHKISLMVGIYQDEKLQKHLLESVEKARVTLSAKELTADYLPIDGMHECTELLGRVLFGKSGGFYGAQTPGGTAALRVGAEFALSNVGKHVYIPDPSWPNHRLIFAKAGFTVHSYPYYPSYERMMEALSSLGAGSIVLLHACCHNPTGLDLTREQWRELSKLMLERGLFPFFDCAYQGLGDGIDEDAFSIRQFMQDGHEMLIGYSCSKNFSMYGQRVGALFAVGERLEEVASTIRQIARAMYSNPPAFGAQIVCEVFKRHEPLWRENLQQMRHRLQFFRNELAKRLERPLLKEHKGMFSYLDLTPDQVKRLRDDFAIYVLDHGRISIAGLGRENMDYVANCLKKVCEEH